MAKSTKGRKSPKFVTIKVPAEFAGHIETLRKLNALLDEDFNEHLIDLMQAGVQSDRDEVRRRLEQVAA